MTKQVINLKRIGSQYKVVSLTNRLEPTVGACLKEQAVKELIVQAQALNIHGERAHDLTVNIK